MSQHYIKIELHNYWHVSSEIHRNKVREALKDKHGFPYISDQQCNGILKDICQKAEFFGRVKKQTTDNLFGHKLHSVNNPKWLKVGSAQLAGMTKKSFLADGSISRLYKKISSNSLDDDGITKKAHLRCIETVIPLTIFATITKNNEATCTDKKFEDALKEFQKALVGRHRIAQDKNSGFGRCTMSLIDMPHSETSDMESVA